MAEIIIKPLITEKLNLLGDKLNKFGFKVDRRATKEEIKKAVEDIYGVTVCDVNTLVVPSKYKTKMTKAGMIEGRKSGYKKAIVTIQEGQTIEVFSEN